MLSKDIQAVCVKAPRAELIDPTIVKAWRSGERWLSGFCMLILIVVCMSLPTGTALRTGFQDAETSTIVFAVNAMQHTMSP